MPQNDKTNGKEKIKGDRHTLQQPSRNPDRVILPIDPAKWLMAPIIHMPHPTTGCIAFPLSSHSRRLASFTATITCIPIQSAAVEISSIGLRCGWRVCSVIYDGFDGRDKSGLIQRVEHLLEVCWILGGDGPDVRERAEERFELLLVEGCG